MSARGERRRRYAARRITRRERQVRAKAAGCAVARSRMACMLVSAVVVVVVVVVVGRKESRSSGGWSSDGSRAGAVGSEVSVRWGAMLGYAGSLVVGRG